MKKIFLTSLLLFGTIQSFAQPFQSLFSDSTSQWNIVRQGVCDAVCTGEYKLTDTVVFDTTTYYKLTSQGMFSNSPIYVREDTLTGQVWQYKEQWAQEEYLIMDLGLGLGDTFKLYDNSNTYDAIVDSVYFVSGLKHVRTNALIGFCGLTVDTLTFIEGTGTTAGLAYQGNIQAGLSEINDFLVCHTTDTNEVYHNSYYPNECFICMVGIEENDFEFQLFPNPASSSITILHDDNLIYTLEIYDLNGRKTHTETSKKGTEIINISNFEDGQYIIKIIQKTGEVSSQRFVKFQ